MTTRKGIPGAENSRGITMTKEKCNKNSWRELITLCKFICSCNEDPNQLDEPDFPSPKKVNPNNKFSKLPKFSKRRIVRNILDEVVDFFVDHVLERKGSSEGDLAEGGEYDPYTHNSTNEVASSEQEKKARRHCQRCVHRKIRERHFELREKYCLFPVLFTDGILSEHPYFIPKIGDTVPLISADMHHMDATEVKWSRWNAAARLKEAKVSQNMINEYIRGDETFSSLRKAGVIGKVDPYRKFSRRAWDAVIVENIEKDATGDNLSILAEMKFGRDDWDQNQWNAAVATVGGEENIDKIQTLTPESCKCDEGEQKLDTEVDTEA